MTLSVWRYAHFALALFSCAFLALASLTGVVLAVDAVNERATAAANRDLDSLNVADAIAVLRKVYPEIIEVSVDYNHVVTLRAIDEEGNDVFACIDPVTGKILSEPVKKSQFIQWTTALHRSLFLHEAGRFFVGLSCFLLLLIAITGSVLIIQRQHNVRRFFSRVVKENFAQYYHAVTGRLLLVPIIILALSGTYLSMVRFGLVSVKKSETTTSKDETKDFSVFRNTALSEVQKIEFPFSDDPDEYYILNLKDRELTIDQFDGSIVSEVKHPWTAVVETFSLDLHTGRANIAWAIVLAIASVSILFFIWSGFKISLKRIAVKTTKNTFGPEDAAYVLLVGSENGSTLRFANAVHQQLLAAKQASFLTELNKYRSFPAARHLVVFTSTYGLGDPPSDATRFLGLLKKHSQQRKIDVSVVGFGSRAYPDFCKYAEEVQSRLQSEEWCRLLLPLHTIDDKSPEQFSSWAKNWSDQTNLPLVNTPAFYNESPVHLRKLVVQEKVVMPDDQTFIITLRPASKTRFASGDLLVIHPANDGRERFYSIGKVFGDIQLVVKLHPGGLGSEYLYRLRPGEVIEGRILTNASFHFPTKAREVVMISNGTGIAPFLGMINENRQKIVIHLYCGFSKCTSITKQYQAFTADSIRKKHLGNYHVAYSQELDCCYVMDLLRRDTSKLADVLIRGGIIMICGSLAMQKDVEIVIDEVCRQRSDYGLEYFKSRGQILADCY